MLQINNPTYKLQYIQQPIGVNNVKIIAINFKIKPDMLRSSNQYHLLEHGIQLFLQFPWDNNLKGILHTSCSATLLLKLPWSIAETKVIVWDIDGQEQEEWKTHVWIIKNKLINQLSQSQRSWIEVSRITK